MLHSFISITAKVKL